MENDWSQTNGELRTEIYKRYENKNSSLAKAIKYKHDPCLG
jgi:hypothetical protein